MKDLKQFFTKCILLLVPVFLIYAFPAGALLLGGELTNLKGVIRRQTGTDQILFGLAYSNPVKYYKLQSTLKRSPEVLVLGTSRAMQLRKDFFKDGVQFYNAGGGISKMAHVSKFLKQIPEGKEPKVIIIGLDQNFFNPNWDNFENDFVEHEFLEADTPLEIIQNSFKKVYSDYVADKFTLKQLASDDTGRIGFSALVHSNGFRNDGSYFNGEALYNLQYNPEKMPDYRLRQTFRYIAGAEDRYIYGKDVSSLALEYLREFLTEAKSRNIYVIGFLPPYQKGVIEKMKSMGDSYQYFFRLHNSVGPLFREFSFGFYNFSDVSTLGASDEYFIDGDHGSDKAYLMLFSEMVKHEKQLEAYTDITSLKAIFEKSKGNSLTL